MSTDISTACIPEECPLASNCVYLAHTSGIKSCRVQEVYIQAVQKKLTKGIKGGSTMDELRVGMLMMPLFSQLVQFQIHGAGVGAVLPGNRPNPLFKESREIIKVLDSMLSKLGGDGRKIGGDGTNKEHTGESDFYDSLFDDAANPPKKAKSTRRAVLSPNDSDIYEED